MAASDKIFALLDIPEPEPVSGRVTSDEVSISLEDVHFSYEEEREILKGVSMEMAAGSFISLVGTSGCGKSTIAGILMGRNPNYRGNIRIGGVESSELTEESRMKTITLVSHNSYLFKGTVEENLRMGKPDASEGELLSALERVNLLGFMTAQQGLKNAGT